MITVIGVGASPLSPSARERIERAALVVGARRHLQHIHACRTVTLTGDIKAAFDAIAACDGEAVVLASGDPGFFGIVRALAERFGRSDLEVIPSVSSVAAAFAHAGLSWDDAIVVSAHGRDPRGAINVCRAHPKVAVLTEPAFGPSELAGALAGLGRRFVVAELLGSAQERIVEGTAEEIAVVRFVDPNVVLVLDNERAVGTKGGMWPPRRSPARWALDEDDFEHRGGMITKAEVRAFALARLGPGTGDLVWDVGAGSGSVAVECALHGAAVVAVERDADACELVSRNADRHGVRVEVVSGEAPDALEGLPDPQAVFVGGTGGAFEAVLEVVAARADRAVVVALAGLERVEAAGELLAGGGLDVDAVLAQAARLRPVAGVLRLAPINPVFLVCGVRA